MKLGYAEFIIRPVLSNYSNKNPYQDDLFVWNLFIIKFNPQQTIIRYHLYKMPLIVFFSRSEPGYVLPETLYQTSPSPVWRRWWLPANGTGHKMATRVGTAFTSQTVMIPSMLIAIPSGKESKQMETWKYLYINKKVLQKLSFKALWLLHLCIVFTNNKI